MSFRALFYYEFTSSQREETGDLLTDSGSEKEEDEVCPPALSTSRDASAPLGDTDNSLDNSDTETDNNQVRQLSRHVHFPI